MVILLKLIDFGDVDLTTISIDLQIIDMAKELKHCMVKSTRHLKKLFAHEVLRPNSNSRKGHSLIRCMVQIMSSLLRRRNLLALL